MSGQNWQGIPDWLIYAIRTSHVNAAKAGEGRAGEPAVDLLTDRVLADDPAFARVIVSRYVRSLVRAPKPRKREKNDPRDRLMAECARLSAEGLSLRKIGERTGVSRQTVANLVAEWQACLPEMSTGLVLAATPAVSPGRQNEPAVLTPHVDATPNVIPLRRPA